MMDILYNGGINLILALQGMGDGLIRLMQVITFLGSEEFFLLILPALYWCIDANLGIRVGVILLLNGAVKDALKLALHGARPFWFTTSVRGYAAETSFGVPSGHAQIATGVWGMVADRLRRWWAWLAAVIIIFLIGISRLFLGVHFPHDVLLGWAIGALLLWATICLWKPVTAWLKKCKTWQQILLGFGFSLVMVLMSLAGYLCLRASWQIPLTWLANAASAFPEADALNPISLDGTLTQAGAFFGLAAGLAVLHRYGGFDTQGPAWKRILRFVVGLAGMLAIRYGLKAIFPEGDNWLACLLRYVRYALIGLWLSAGAPAVFWWLKLAARKTRKR